MSTILCLVFYGLLYITNDKQITYCITIYSLLPLFLLLITCFILSTHHSFDPQQPQQTRTSYNVFEGNLSVTEIKMMYEYSNIFSLGFILPFLIIIFFFDNFIKQLSILLFIISIVGGLAYGRSMLHATLKERKSKEQKELENEIKKEQGYR